METAMWWWYDAWQGWGLAPVMMIVCMGMMALMMFFMHGRSRHRADETLERRFERGEISRGEYEEARRILGR